MERESKIVIAERCLVPVGEAVTIVRDCPGPMGPPWRLHVSPQSELVVSGLFVGMLDLLDERREFRPMPAVWESPAPRTGVAANAFAGNGPGLPLHGPRLERGSVLAVDLFNPWLSAAEVWVSLFGTLPGESP